jgi:hypothetical protein
MQGLILRAYSRHRGQLPLSEPHPDVCGHCVLESTKRASIFIGLKAEEPTLLGMFENGKTLRDM